MSTGDLDRLLRFYTEELSYLRDMGQIFAERYPKIAQRLELGPTEIGDPHVERLVEAFAFLTGRLQMALHDDFPEIARELLDALHPHYLAPLPSMGVARFEPDLQGATSGEPIPRGTKLFARPEDVGSERAGDVGPCWFRTCSPVTVWPVRVAEAGFVPLEEHLSFSGAAQRAASVLRLVLEPGQASFADLGLDRIRFYLHGTPTRIYPLYELLFAQTLTVWAVPDRGPARELSATALRPLGFDDDEAVLPDPPNDHPAYRLLQEYFVFPEKFHFLEISHLEGLGERRLEILFFFARAPESALPIRAENFCPGATPVINLFPKTSEPIHVDQTRTEYRLIPDVRRQDVTEVHSILGVHGAAGPDRRRREYAPFYSLHHDLAERGHGTFWHARRVLARREGVLGTDVLLSFLDLDWHPSLPADETIYAQTLCTNRDLPTHIQERGRLMSDGAGSDFLIYFVKRPIRPRTPPLDGQTLWRLVSHLQVSHLSLTDDEQGLNALREMLRLYIDAYAPSEQQQVGGVQSLDSRKVARLMADDPHGGFVRGTEVLVTFDEDRYQGSSAFLLASVLERVFGLFASLGSFTQLVIQSRQREGEWKRWPPRAGDQPLL